MSTAGTASLNPGNHGCPRCGGYVYQDNDGLSCMNCSATLADFTRPNVPIYKSQTRPRMWAW